MDLHADPRAGSRRETLRRVTVATAIAALGLNAVLFVQTSSPQLTPGAINDAILSAIGSLFPGAVRAPAAGPVATPSPAVAVTGGS